MDKEMLWSLIRIIILLPIICALAFITVKYGLGQAQRGSFTKKRRMKLIEQISLGPKCGLSLVQVGKEYLLLAHQDGSIILVSQMDQLPEELNVEMPELKSLGQLIKDSKIFGSKHSK